jgi:signal transduction histidine kinase
LRALRALDSKSAITVPLTAHGKALGVLAFMSSAVARRFTAEDLKLAEALALRAALSIDNARLHHVTQRALQARDDVLGIVAHDLRNPLNAIVLEAECLRRSRGEPADSTEPAAAIHRAAVRMSRMIQDLLDIARLESGRLQIERIPLSTHQLIADAAEAQRPIAAASSLELRLDVTHDVPDVWADRGRLLQVFDNLIGNALKFTGHGGRITIGAVPKGREVQFRIRDTGIGIRPNELAHVFDRFWQARTAERDGAGLGLPIVKGIVEAHGGRVWAESTLGEGSSFFFAIPAASSTAPDPVRDTSPLREAIQRA